MIVFSFLSFLLIFHLKKSKMRSKIEQLEKILQDSELQVSWQLSRRNVLLTERSRGSTQIGLIWSSIPLSGLNIEQLFPCKSPGAVWIMKRFCCFKRLFCPAPQSYSRHQSCAKENELHSWPKYFTVIWNERPGTAYIFASYKKKHSLRMWALDKRTVF